MPRSPDDLVEAQQHRATENTARRNAGVTFQQPDDWDAWWATYDPAEAEQRQQAAWRQFTQQAAAPRTARRTARATRTARVVTARRTASMAGSASSDSGGGGSDSDPPSSPAALAAEGRAEGEAR